MHRPIFRLEPIGHFHRWCDPPRFGIGQPPRDRRVDPGKIIACITAFWLRRHDDLLRSTGPSFRSDLDRISCHPMSANETPLPADAALLAALDASIAESLVEMRIGGGIDLDLAVERILASLQTQST